MFNQIDERDSLRFRRQNVLSDNLIKRLQLFGTLEGHEGCVNSIEWNYPGSKLCSVSDDCNIIIWDPFKKKKLTQFHSNHTGNIFAAKFLDFNHENLLVTAAADWKSILHDLVTHEHLMICQCHRARIKKLATQSHDSSLYWSAGEDGLVLQNDIRTNHTCNQDKLSNVLIDLNKHCGSKAKISSIACNPVRNELIAVGTNDQFVRLYDRRMIRTMEIKSTFDNLPEDCVQYFTIGVSPTKRKSLRKSYHSLACTHLSFSQTGNELLANMSSDNIYLFNILNPKKPKIFTTDLTNLFGVLEEEFDIVDDCSMSSESKRFKSNVLDSSQNSSPFSSSLINLPNSSKIVKDSPQNKSDSSANNLSSTSINDQINNSQMQSTSKVVDEDAEMIVETLESNQNASKKLIKKMNKKPNLIKYKAKAKLPKHISPIYRNAQSLIKKEKYSDAIELINEAINLMPNVSHFYCLRANAMYERKWSKDLFCALKDFYRSLEIDPNNKESHLKLAQCLYDLNYYENAYQCLNYFRQKQSKDTRYKEFKELENKIQDALKQDKQLHDDKKKFTQVKTKKNESRNCKEFFENLGKSYFSLSHNSSSNADEHEDQSSSFSSLSSSSSTINSFFDNIEPTFSESEDRNTSADQNSHLFDSDMDSNDSFHMNHGSHEVKRYKSKKELQWRANSYDFDQRFYGHCNISTDIMEANFFGSDGQYIVGGSDDGNFYIWNRETTNIVNIIKADECIVNAVQPHYNSCFLATSGIDNSIKLWAPTMSEDDLKEQEKTRKWRINQRSQENQKKKTSNHQNYGIMFLRVTHLSNDSSDSDNERTDFRQAALNIRECLPS